MHGLRTHSSTVYPKLIHAISTAVKRKPKPQYNFDHRAIILPAKRLVNASNLINASGYTTNQVERMLSQLKISPVMIFQGHPAGIQGRYVDWNDCLQVFSFLGLKGNNFLQAMVSSRALSSRNEESGRGSANLNSECDRAPANTRYPPASGQLGLAPLTSYQSSHVPSPPHPPPLPLGDRLDFDLWSLRLMDACFG
jgi:hypothetical protein